MRKFTVEAKNIFLVRELLKDSSWSKIQNDSLANITKLFSMVCSDAVEFSSKSHALLYLSHACNQTILAHTAQQKSTINIQKEAYSAVRAERQHKETAKQEKTKQEKTSKTNTTKEEKSMNTNIFANCVSIIAILNLITATTSQKEVMQASWAISAIGAAKFGGNKSQYQAESLKMVLGVKNGGLTLENFTNELVKIEEGKKEIKLTQSKIQATKHILKTVQEMRSKWINSRELVQAATVNGLKLSPSQVRECMKVLNALNIVNVNFTMQKGNFYITSIKSRINYKPTMTESEAMALIFA